MPEESATINAKHRHAEYHITATTKKQQHCISGVETVQNKSERKSMNKISGTTMQRC